MIPDNVIQRVNDLDIIKIFEDEGFQPVKAGGGEWKICCPFHNEKTPSLHINVSKGLWHCFGCGVGGNGVQFIMRLKAMTFSEAVRYLAQKNGIRIEEEELTPEQKEAAFHRERLFKINQVALEFFRSQLTDPAAQEVLKKRSFGEDVANEFQLGYAPRGNRLLTHLRSLGWTKLEDQRLMVEAGLIGLNDDTGEPYDFFRGRLMFPIFNTAGMVVGFSGRDITEKAAAKYVNTKESPVFRKGDELFGWAQAHRRIGAETKAVLVEGNPDVIRLHEIGVDTAIASLGTALTEEQVKVIARKAQSVIIIGDRDVQKDKAHPKALPGEDAVIRNGELLTRGGLVVQVMELPQDDPEEKVDADSYFKIRKNIADFNELLSTRTVDYIPFMASRMLLKARNEQEKSDAIRNVCQLLSYVKDETTAEMYLSTFKSKYKNATIWQKSFAKAKGDRDRESKIQDGSQDMMSDYGFYIADNCYCSTASGSVKRWSNFVMKPILHIRDEKNARRIYELVNNKGQCEVVKMNQSEMVSFADFKTRVETAGNFIWEASQNELTTLKKYLYDGTPSADEIRQMGWQKQWGFYAWGNGAFDNAYNFVKADKYGIVEIGGRKFYLPGCATDTAANTQGYQQQRRFVYVETSDTTLRAYAEQLVRCFGEKAKIGLCFLVATMFRDIVVGVTTSFPILNLFGPKGTGKSELGHALTAFFIPNYKAPNMNNTTKAALAEAVAEVSNALVHLDEYKKALDLDKQEFLKGIWDGSGRSRLNMDDKKSREMTAVDAGVIMSGQEMATVDPALFNRLVFVPFSKSEFSDEEKRDFEHLQILSKRGMTHLTRGMLALRPRFEASFRMAWDNTLDEMNDRMRKDAIEDRTLRNWATILAAYRCVADYLDLPMNYREMLDICVSGCVDQNSRTKQGSERSKFWEIIETLVSSSQIFAGVDYKIKLGGKPAKMRNRQTTYEFAQSKRYLYLNFSRPSMLYGKAMRDCGEQALPRDSLKYYLEQSAEYIGSMQSVRFNVADVSGHRSANNASKTYQAMVFDYDAIEQNYGISLEVAHYDESIDDITPSTAPAYAPPPPYNGGSGEEVSAEETPSYSLITDDDMPY